jgi:rhodanese-related sulfurtransferase
VSETAFNGDDIAAVDAMSDIRDGRAWLLDVREQWEYDAVHAPAAHHIPMGELAARQAELPSSQTVYVVCHTGRRSRTVVDALIAAEYPARNIAGGMDAWLAAGGEAGGESVG